MNSKVIKSNSKAEILSICLDIEWGKKICFTTCYRVGTLNQENLIEIDRHINMISNTKTIKSHTLFNEYFYKQFSEKSTYNMHIDFHNDRFENFNFSLTTVLSELRNIDANKAVEPDGIHGTVLKMCAATLTFPITKIFNLSFSLGQIPSDWKTANVVPVHKKVISVILKTIAQNH